MIKKHSSYFEDDQAKTKDPTAIGRPRASLSEWLMGTFGIAVMAALILWPLSGAFR